MTNFFRLNNTINKIYVKKKWKGNPKEDIPPTANTIFYILSGTHTLKYFLFHFVFVASLIFSIKKFRLIRNMIFFVISVVITWNDRAE